MHGEKKEGTSVNLSPKTSFALGLLGGILVLCTLGFFVMLFVVLGDDDSKTTKKTTTKTTATAPTPSAPPPAPPPAGEVAPVTDADHIRGDVDAPVTLVEYSDFECPFCSRFHPTMTQLMEEYEGQVRWVYRHFPLSFHPQATPAALASECAAEQGEFWGFADGLFENQSQLGPALYNELAVDLGLNVPDFDECVSSKKYADDVSADLASGSAAGVTGTPGTVIIASDGSTQLVPGALPYEQVKAMVDAAL